MRKRRRRTKEKEKDNIQSTAVLDCGLGTENCAKQCSLCIAGSIILTSALGVRWSFHWVEEGYESHNDYLHSKHLFLFIML